MAFASGTSVIYAYHLICLTQIKLLETFGVHLNVIVATVLSRDSRRSLHCRPGVYR